MKNKSNTIKPSQDKTVEKTINWIPMPCVNCHKVTKVPEHSLYCMECNPDPVEEFARKEREIKHDYDIDDGLSGFDKIGGE